MKKYLLFFPILSILVLSGCTDSNEGQTGTGEVSTGVRDSLIQEYTGEIPAPKISEPEVTEVVDNFSENNEDTENNTNSDSESVSGDETVGSGSIKPAPSVQSWFGVEECDKIINFDLCVISKAPIENQEVMKENLQKAIEPWKLLAKAQLREVCQKATEKDTFKEVVEHYEALDEGCYY